MAILKSLIVRGGRKQIGGMVLYSRNGETVARELAAQISNPRTPDQMQQRVKLSNLVAFYRANRSWMKGAFENKKERESDYNAFVSNNISNTQVALAKSDVDSGAAIVGPYAITSGSLPKIEATLNGTNLTSNIYLGNFSITSATTVGQLSQAILANNNGIVAGMQLSVIINLQQTVAATGVPYITVRAYELIIDPASTDLVTDSVPNNILTATGSTNKVLTLDTSNLGDGGGAFILSQTTGGTTRVSSQSLVFFGSNATYRSYTSAAAWSRAMASYGEGQDTFLSSASAGQAQAVVTTLSLLGIVVDDQECVQGTQLSAALASGSTIDFNFNRAYDAGATITAYYKIGNSATHYALTNIEEALDRKSFIAYVGSTQLPSADENITFVAVIDGDEYPITVKNMHEDED